MQEEEHGDFTSAGRRRRTLWIVAIHVLIGVTFFVATFYWGDFE